MKYIGETRTDFFYTYSKLNIYVIVTSFLITSSSLRFFCFSFDNISLQLIKNMLLKISCLIFTERKRMDKLK